MARFAGHLHLGASARDDGTTFLASQSFRAPFHLSKPYWDPEARTLVVQVVNPTAGILEGDALASSIRVEAGAALLVTTPSASRIFRMDGGEAVARQEFHVAAGGWLEVLPEPLVPHRGSRFRQSTQVELVPGAGLFYVDQLQPGRVGHGEAWAWSRLQLDLSVHVAGQLVLRERFDHEGAALHHLAGWAGSGDAACFANAVFFPPVPVDAAKIREIAAALPRPGLWVGLSALERDGWSARLVANGSVTLRDGLADLRRALAGLRGAPLAAIRKY